MSVINHPTGLWQRDSLAVAVATVELAGEILPLSLSLITLRTGR